MGVKGLQYFVEAKCPEACYKVNILKLAAEYRASTGREPVIVVDGMSCLKRWYTDLEWIYGGQWREYVALLKRFCSSFRKGGIKLVFFFDGPTPEVKRPLWVQRRVQGGRDIEDIFRSVRKMHSKPTDPKIFQFPVSMGMITRFIIKYECDCETYTSVMECDIEVAEFAVRNGCFGILAQDSDYMIFDSAPYYLSSQYLNIETLETTNYDREAFAWHLGLTVDHLPLLASLIGNDVVNAQDLVLFHRRICKDAKFVGKPRAEHIVPKVAQFMRHFKDPSFNLSKTALTSISKNVFGDPHRAQLLYESVHSYELFQGLDEEGEEDVQEDGTESINESKAEGEEGATKRPTVKRMLSQSSQASVAMSIKKFQTVQPQTETARKLWEMAKERHLNCEVFPYIYAALSTRTWESSSALEDLSSDMPAAALVFRSLRQRIYGVLYGLKPDVPGEKKEDKKRREASEDKTKRVRVSEWCVYKGCVIEEADFVEVAPPPEKTKPMEILWLEDTQEVIDWRWKTFCTCLNPKQDLDHWKTLPAKYLILVAVLHYLTKGKSKQVLHDWEVNAFIAQAVSPVVNNLQQLHVLKLERVDARPIHMATMFMRGVSNVLFLLGVCNYPVPLQELLPHGYFDGKLFHHYYMKSKLGAKVSTLCENKEDIMHLFWQLKRAVGGHPPVSS